MKGRVKFEKIKDAEAISYFAKQSNIPPELVSSMEITPHGDVLTPSKSRTFTLGHVDRESGTITINTQEAREFIFTNQLELYVYNENEQVPMFIDNNPMQKARLEHRMAETTYSIEMSNSYNLHISPIALDGMSLYAFSVGTNPSVRDISERFVSAGWKAEDIESIYTKLHSMKTIPVIRDNIINDPWDNKTSMAIAQYMEEMVHPEKSQDIETRWNNIMDFVSPDLYQVMSKISSLYKSPSDIQKMAMAMLETDKVIKQPEKEISQEMQHTIRGELLDANDKLEIDTVYDRSNDYENIDDIHDTLDNNDRTEDDLGDSF